MTEEIIKMENDIELIFGKIKFSKEQLESINEMKLVWQKEALKDIFTEEEIRWLQLLLTASNRQDLSTPILKKLRKLKNEYN